MSTVLDMTARSREVLRTFVRFDILVNEAFNPISVTKLQKHSILRAPRRVTKP